jgi:hypothetical protein
VITLRIHRTKVDHLGPVTQSNTCHTACRTALWSNSVGSEMQQLRITCDEDQLFVTGCEFNCANDRITIVEPDDRPRVSRRWNLGVDSLDHSVSSSHGDANTIPGDRAKPDGRLGLVHRDKSPERNTTRK